MTIHYAFPCMHWWHTVAKHFEGNENFVIADKGDYFVVNYVRMGKDTHPPVMEGEPGDYARAAVLREARGLIFCSKTGELLSHPFHKFFNLGEREDVMEIDLSKPHVIMEKLDGSMIRPFRIGDTIRWGTKMGVTDVSMQAEEFVAKNPQYQKFAESAIHDYHSFTPIFEWCSRKQRIVIDYPEDKLVLLAMRDNFTGEYLSRRDIEALGKAWNIPVVNVLDVTDPVPSQEELVAMIRNMSDMEGVVVQFADGHMVKIKADTYVALHRAKSLLENERDVVGLILDDKIDDLLPLLPASDRERLIKFEADVWHDIRAFRRLIDEVFYASVNMTRKEFALSTSEFVCPLLRAAVFKHWDTRSCSVDHEVELIRKHLGSKSAYEKIKPILKTAMWKEVKTDE